MMKHLAGDNFTKYEMNVVWLCLQQTLMKMKES